jgi:hypothetical protein
MTSSQQQDYDTLTLPGNIAYYGSCEVTQLFLLDKQKKTYNAFILACFEEKPFTATNQHFLTPKPLKLSDTLSLGLQRYWLSLPQAAAVFTRLQQATEWDFNGNASLKLPVLIGLTKQFVPGNEGVRLNAVLKNNFGGGSYVLEFFDESKQYVQPLFALEHVNALNQVSEQIRAVVPLDLAVVRERLGNILFQFPIRLLVSHSRALPSWNGIQLHFRWHPQLTTIIPECVIQVEAELDQLYLGSTVEAYRGQAQQDVLVGNLDGLNRIKIWRTSPPLLLHVFSGIYLRDLDIHPSIVQPEQRVFHTQDHPHTVTMQSADRPSHIRAAEPVPYRRHVNNVLYTAGRQKLEQELAFKQYFQGMKAEALADLRTLLNRYGQQGAWLWDPYLSAEDVLTTLFFCQYAGVPLRAIGSDNASTKLVNQHKGKPTATVLAEYATTLHQNTVVPAGLRLEFRLQHGSHGWAFHDRFLIFPALADAPTRAYSLGKSVNSVGDSHHILQEVNHPQRIADAFQQLWNSLANAACLVWKI